MKKVVILKALTATTIALSGCSSTRGKTTFLQCIHEPSNYVFEYKIEGEDIWSFVDNKWKKGSDIKFSKSVIIYRDYFNNSKTTYNEYTINRVTGVLNMSPDLNTSLKLPVSGMVAKCSTIDEDKLKF